MPRGFPHCKTCGRQSPYRDYIENGWYQLSVHDSAAPKGYRYLGLFCSIVCLAQHLPEMSRVEADIQRRLESQVRAR